MLLFNIFFYSSPSGAFSYLLKGGRLSIEILQFDYKGFFQVIGKNFKWSICYAHKH
jgi:hypothetical protein